MVIVRECWTRQWTKEATLPEVIHCKTVLGGGRTQGSQPGNGAVTGKLAEPGAAPGGCIPGHL